jgi:hypothetical protein
MDSLQETRCGCGFLSFFMILIYLCYASMRIMMPTYSAGGIRPYLAL